MGGVTVRLTGVDALVATRRSPAYEAVRVWVPGGVKDVVNEACPDELGAAVPITVEESRKFTLPESTGTKFGWASCMVGPTTPRGHAHD